MKSSEADALRAALDVVRQVQKTVDHEADALSKKFLALEKVLRESKVRVPASVLILGHADDDERGWFLTWGKHKNQWSLLIQQVSSWNDDERSRVEETIPIADAELMMRKCAASHCAELLLVLGRLADNSVAQLRAANSAMDAVLTAIGVDPARIADDFPDDDLPF